MLQFRILFVSALIALTALPSYANEEPSSDKKSVTGFGTNLGSDHFLSVGVTGGGGLFYAILPAPNWSIEAGITLLDHLEIKPSYGSRSMTAGGTVYGTWNIFSVDILFRTATGHGFFIGPTFASVSFTPGASLPGGLTAISGSTIGVKVGRDYDLTHFLSLGLQMSYLAGFIDGNASIKFWF